MTLMVSFNSPNLKGKVLLNVQEHIKEAPCLYLESNIPLNFQIISERWPNTYILPIPKDWVKIYNKVTHGQWSTLTTEETILLLKNNNYLTLIEKRLIIEAVVKSDQAYYNYIRVQNKKWDIDIVKEFAKIYKEKNPNAELLAPINDNVSLRAGNTN